ncbi:MAG: hypothetical protein ACRESJ_28975 [Pseudomonas sp.]|uniref:hypothetical protein n=1 Tax=Pseudomonas sp. TaxID=306 RepID=UPI003D6E9044
MNSDTRGQALAAWHELLMKWEVTASAQEQYEQLLSVADKYQRAGLISVGERNDLILQATRHYASAVERLGQDHEPERRSPSYPVPAQL